MSGQPLTLEDIVRRTSDLPTLSAAAVKVVREADSSTSSAASLAQILAADPALSVRVLRLANSAYYGMARRISNLQEAVVVLGMRTVRNLAMVAATYPWMSKSVEGYGLGPRELWTHSFATALGAQLVARSTKKCPEEPAFVAGLLHDIGKVALSVWLTDKVKALVAYAKHEGIPFDEAERKVFGYDHCEVGAFLAERWNLPADIVAAIRHHHTPDTGEALLPIVDCVHVGNYLTLTMGFGLGADGLNYQICEGSFVRLGISLTDLDEITDKFVVGYEEYERLFSELTAA